MSEIVITASDLSAKQRSLERIINGPNYKIRDRLTELGVRHSDPTSSKSLASVFDCFSVIDLLYYTFSDSRLLGKELNLMLSTYVGADFGLHTLNGNGDGKVKAGVMNQFEMQNIDFKTEAYPHPRDKMLAAYSSSLDRYADVGLSTLTKQFFSWMKDEALTEWELHPDSRNAIDSINGKILDDYKFKGMSTKISRLEEKSDELTWANFAGYEDVVKYFKDLLLITQNVDYSLKLDTLKMKDLLPKGILLYGPPGTGKTTIARTFCNEAGIPFDIFSTTEIGDKYQNSAKNDIQKRFDDAAKYIRTGESRFSLLFIDELESLGKTVGGSNNGGNEDDKGVETMQMNMSGHRAEPGVVVVGATNRPDLLDKALIRPGRFSEWKYMGALSRDEARKALELYTSKGCERIDIEKLLNTYYTSSEPDPLQNPRQMVWTGAFVEEITNKAKRKKLIEHLKERSRDYLIGDNDLVHEIKNYK